MLLMASTPRRIPIGEETSPELFFFLFRRNNNYHFFEGEGGARAHVHALLLAVQSIFTEVEARATILTGAQLDLGFGLHVSALPLGAPRKFFAVLIPPCLLLGSSLLWATANTCPIYIRVQNRATVFFFKLSAGAGWAQPTPTTCRQTSCLLPPRSLSPPRVSRFPSSFPEHGFRRKNKKNLRGPATTTTTTTMMTTATNRHEKIKINKRT